MNAAPGLVNSVVPFSVVDGPGSRFVVFLQGCNFDCVACHNPQTIPGHAPVDGHAPRHRTVAELETVLPAEDQLAILQKHTREDILEQATEFFRKGKSYKLPKN